MVLVPGGYWLYLCAVAMSHLSGNSFTIACFIQPVLQILIKSVYCCSQNKHQKLTEEAAVRR